MSVVFEKLSFVKRLEDAGTFSRPQAETLSDAFHQAVSETVATRQHVASIRTDLSRDIAELRHEMVVRGTELKQEISQTRIDLQNEAGLLRSELKAGLAETRVRTVSAGATIIAVLAAIKYFG